MKRLRLVVPIMLIAVAATYILWPRALADPTRIEGSGTIEATQVDVAPKVPGRLLRLHAREGARVEAGQLVAELDAEELEAQLAQARAALAAAEARFSQAEAALGLQRAQQDAAFAQARAAVKSMRVRVPQAEEAARLQQETAEAQIRHARAQLEAARASRRAAESAVGTAEANLRAAEATLSRAQADLSRLERLHAEGAISAQQLDAARQTAATALAQRDAVRAQREALADQVRVAAAVAQQVEAALAAAEANRRTVTVRELETEALRSQVDQSQAALRSVEAGAGLVTQRAREVEAARAAVAQARAAVSLALIIRSHARLRSPMAGVVVSRSVEVGDLVAAGAPVLTVADLTRPYLRVYVAETDLGRVKLGQPVEVRVDAFPGRVFRGAVAEISDRAEFTPGNVQTREERVKLVFAVKVELSNPDGVLKPGLPADAVILTGDAGN
jgi:HlyD family secretion protein